MNILGLHLGHDASAAVIVDDRLTAMVERERLTRIKYDRGFMPQMVDDALRLAGIEYKDVDAVALSLSSGSNESPKVRLDDLWGITITKHGLKYINGPRQLQPWNMENNIVVKFDGVEKPAYQVQHHVAHAAASFYTSKFDTAIAFTYDGSGMPDEQTSLICKCEGNKVEVEGIPNASAALAYGTISRYVYGSWRDSGKLMGLAAYGEPELYKDSFMEDTTITGMLNTLNSNFQNPHIWKELHKYNWKNKIVCAVAASVQKWLEEDVTRVLDFIDKKYGEDVDIVSGGGGALNVIANRLIYDRHPLFNVPFTKDDGMAPGGALYLLHHVYDRPRQDYSVADITFLGDGEPERKYNLAEIAQDLADGKVVLWHQGRSETGPRALTHRSIFADPRNADVKRKVSEEIKGREEYRPLAPIVLEEDCLEWFDVSPNPLTELMLLNARVKKPDLIPAVTHVDGTARVQTISEEFNPSVWLLLKNFKELTGVPVLINTSLNIQGQAICETERDTLWTFDNCDADVCVINGKVYRK